MKINEKNMIVTIAGNSNNDNNVLTATRATIG